MGSTNHHHHGIFVHVKTSIARFCTRFHHNKISCRQHEALWQFSEQDLAQLALRTPVGTKLSSTVLLRMFSSTMTRLSPSLPW